MPLDAVCLQAVVAELSPLVAGSRIEKIQQPARDQVVLLLRGSRRLLLSAGGGQPRLHLTELLRDNPAQPPMFCMLLRKYLSGGIIEKIEQIPLERVVNIHISAADELGERRRFSLILEAFPRRANLILADKDGRILDCLRRIDFEMNPDRQVLPGLFYRFPAAPDKVDPFTVEREMWQGRICLRISGWWTPSTVSHRWWPVRSRFVPAVPWMPLRCGQPRHFGPHSPYGATL